MVILAHLLAIINLSWALTVSEQFYSIDKVSPTHLKICKDILWIKSLNENVLQGYRVKDGTLEKIEKLPEGTSLTALGCFKEQLVIGLRSLQDKKVIIRSGARVYQQTPGMGPIRDFREFEGRFYILRNRMLVTSDLINFETIKFKSIKETSPDQSELIENPFKDWQRKMHVGESSYAKMVMTEGQIIALDHSLGMIVAAGPTLGPILYRQAAPWGVWEGHIMYPKDLALLERDLIVSDVGLKIVHRFDPKGRFVESYTINNLEERFGYPIALETKGKLLFLADFLKNKIYALNLNVGGERRSGVFRRNHLKSNDLSNWDQIRCLNCHDGTEASHMNVFRSDKSHHPTLKEVKNYQGDLPLLHKRWVSCSSCHDHHHVAHQDKEGNTISHFLRKKSEQLCLECHQDFTKSENHHFDIKSKKIANNCLSCHQVHEANPKLLKQDSIKSCTSCHKNQEHKSSHPIGKKSTCLDCHRPHDSKAEWSWAKTDANQNAKTCTECHKDQTEYLGTNKHLQLLPKPKAHWPENEQTCLSCHKPHDGQHSAEARCLECHKEERGHSHQRPLSVAHAGRAQGLVLGSGHRLSCITCHDPHLGKDEEKYLRLKDVSKIKKLCASCHTGDMDVFYKEFHSRFKRMQQK